MAAALECWSSRTGASDEDMVEQVLMRTHDRSEALTSPVTAPDQTSSAMQKRFQRLSRNVSEAIASLKNSLNLDSARDNQQAPSVAVSGGAPSSKTDGSGGGGRKLVWATVVRHLAKMYPGSQLPEKLVSNLRKHYDSLPLSYSQAGFDMKEVFLHIKLIEQASGDDNPALMIQEVSDGEAQGSMFKLTFACNSSLSWSTMSGALDSASICCKKIQIFEKKGLTLGVVLLLVQSGQEKLFKTRIENALKSAIKKPKPTSVKLPFGLCGCQEQSTAFGELGDVEEESIEPSYRLGIENSNTKIQLRMPLPSSSFSVSVDEWQTIQSGGDEIGKWLLNPDYLDFGDQIGPNSFRGIYRGKRVGIEKLKGCEKGNSYEFELRKDLLELMTCGHRNILQFYGVCIDENDGLCVITKLMEGGSLQELMLKNKKLQTKEILRIAVDIAEGVKFINEHGVAYRDLNTLRILLDKNGNACLGDMGIVTACKSVGEALEYETDGYRWLAPEEKTNRDEMIEQAKRDTANLEKALEERAREIDYLKSKIKGLVSDKEEMEIGKLGKEAKINELEKKLNNLNEIVQSLRNEERALQEQVMGLEKNRDKAVEKEKEMALQIDALVKEKGNEEWELEKLMEEKNLVKKQMDSAVKENSEKEKLIDELSQKKKELEGHIVTRETDLVELNREVDDLKREMGTLKNDYIDQTEKNEKLIHEVSQLRNALSHVELQIDNIEKALGEEKRIRVDLKAKVSDLEKTIEATVKELKKINSYSFGMVVWEMVTGEVAYACCSPVQAAIGIAACGLRPEIPKDCPQGLGSLMNKCWNSCPSKPLNFSEIVSLLVRSVSRILIERELENEREMLKFENVSGATST